MSANSTYRVPAVTFIRLHQALANAHNESALAMQADEDRIGRTHLAELQRMLSVAEWLLSCAQLGLTPAAGMENGVRRSYPNCPGPLV